MPKRIPRYLRLHTEEAPAVSPTLEDLEPLNKCRESFRNATGWDLRLHDEEDGTSPSCVSLDVDTNCESKAIPESTAADLADSISDLSQELHKTRIELWRREAELAAGVPVTPREDEDEHLAERLETIVRGGAEAVGCQAAAAYLLDDATSELKLRTSWNLPRSRYANPARPLRGAMADLEALVGHAVVLEDTRLLPSWNSPEDYPAAVCVPISTPSAPLGTLWIFSDEPRDFSTSETNLIEIVAGRLASELEREILLQEGVEAKQHNHDVSGVAYWQQNRLPTIAPPLDGWDVSGWTLQRGKLGGAMHDWTILPDGMLSLAIGHGHGDPVESALNATTLHTALKAHAFYRHDAREMTCRVNETFWTSSVGDQSASLTYALVHPETGQLDVAAAGLGVGIIFDDRGHRTLELNTPALGADPNDQHGHTSGQLCPKSTLVLCSEGVVRSFGSGSIDECIATMAEQLAGIAQKTAAETQERIIEVLLAGERTTDLSLLVLRRN